jgi:hypothetical protein
MKRKNLIALIGACTCAIGLMLIAFPSPSVNAEQPPGRDASLFPNKKMTVPIGKSCFTDGLARMQERAG